MIIKELKKFSKTLASQKLSVEEKTVMRNAVLNFVRENKIVRKQNSSRLLFLGGLINNLKETKLMPVALIIAILITVSGGTSLAAEQAVPGDLLYPVKINVNENLRAAVNFSNEAKVDWEIDKVERRLEEVEQLKIKNRLDAQGSAEAKTNITAQIKTVSKLTTKFEDSKKSSSANSRLEAVLKGHAQVLLAIANDDQATAEIILNVLEDTKEVSENRVEAENNISADSKVNFKVAAEMKMRTADRKITEVKKIINNVSSSLSESTKARVDAQLNSALKIYGEGELKLNQESYNEAFVKFQEALRLAQEAQVIAKSANRLNIDWQIKLNDSNSKDESDKPDETASDEDQPDQNKNADDYPVRIEALINAANKINIRTEMKNEVENKDSDDETFEQNRQDQNRNRNADGDDEEDDEEKNLIEVEIDGELDSDSVNLNLNSDLNL